MAWLEYFRNEAYVRGVKPSDASATDACNSTDGSFAIPNIPPMR